MNFKMYFNIFAFLCFFKGVLTYYNEILPNQWKVDDMETIVRDQVRSAMQIKDPKDREDVIVSLLLTETKKVHFAAQDLGILKAKCKEEYAFKSILVVLSHVEHMENEFLPVVFRNSNSRYIRWVVILYSGQPRVQQILDRVLSFYAELSRKEAIETFARAVQEICGDLSNKSFNTVDSETLEKISNSDVERKRMLGLLGIAHDQKYTKALQVIAVTLRMAGGKIADTLSDLKCVTIYPSKESFRGGEDEDKDVYAFFPITRPKSVIFKNGTGNFTDSFTVQFESVFDSAEAAENNLGWLKGQRVALQLTTCSE